MSSCFADWAGQIAALYEASCDLQQKIFIQPDAMSINVQVPAVVHDRLPQHLRGFRKEQPPLPKVARGFKWPPLCR